MKFLYPLVTLLGVVAAQDVILNDLNQRVSPQITKLANDVQDFPESGLDGALVGSSRPSVKLSKTLTTYLGHRLRFEGLGYYP